MNRARVTAAKACTGASATDLSLGVHAAGRAADRQHHRACGVDRIPPRPNSRCTETRTREPTIVNINASGGGRPSRGPLPRDITSQTRTPATPGADGTETWVPVDNRATTHC